MLWPRLLLCCPYYEALLRFMIIIDTVHTNPITCYTVSSILHFDLTALLEFLDADVYTVHNC